MSKIERLGVFKDFNDGSQKNVFSIDGKIVEMTLLFNREDRDVVCVPTHHFCNLGCKMCHLTNSSVKKPMLPIDINTFMYCFKNTLLKDNNRITNKRKLLISFMGVGEPLLNFELIKNVYKQENFICEELNYDYVGYSLSTMMPHDKLLTMTDEIISLGLPLKIHFSLHTPVDERRFDLLPSTNVRVADALNMLVKYSNAIQNDDVCVNKYNHFHSNNIPVEIHYTLIDGVNDSDDELKYLCTFLKKYLIPIKFIQFNPINSLVGSKNEDKWIKKIKFEIPNLHVKTYSPPGREIGSSCGEFTKHYYHEEIETEEELLEFEEWKKKHQID